MREPLVRFSVAIGGELLRRFDQYREEHQYPNRSEAVRGLMRDALIEEAIENEESPAMGVVTLVYNHHAGRISDILTEIQHRQLDSVVTTTHVHLDVERCLEVILLRGSVKIVRELANALIGTKGVETGELVLTSAYAMPESNADLHGHEHSHAHDQHHHDHPSARIKKQKRKPKTS